MKGNYNFYIMQNGKPEKIEYSSNLKIKLSKKEKENLRRMRKHRSGTIRQKANILKKVKMYYVAVKKLMLNSIVLDIQ